MPAVRLAIRDETATGKLQAEHLLDDVPDQITVRELIRLRVRDEVARHNATPRELFSGLVCPVGAEAELNGYRFSTMRQIDWEKQADAAVRAFEHNGFFVLIGGGQVTDLDRSVDLLEATEVTFVRLVPLVGG